VLRDRRTATSALLVAVAAVLWGLWPTVLRTAGLAAFQVALVVQVVQALPAPVMAWRERAAFRDRGAVWALVLFGVFDAAQCMLYFPALARGPVAVAALTHYLGPVLVALAAPFVPGERTSRRAMAAAPLSLLGLLLVMGPPRSAPVATALLGAGSAFFGAATLFTVRRAGRSFSPLAVGSLHAVLSAVLVLAATGRASIPPAGAGTVRVALAALVLGIGASVLFVRAVRSVPSAVASTITYVEPVTAAGLGALVLGEPLGAAALAGAAVVIGAGAWVAFEPAARGAARGGPAAASNAEERRAA
jgi:drug/metabolite transporter (DMT)-like permease